MGQSKKLRQGVKESFLIMKNMLKENWGFLSDVIVKTS